MVSKGQRGGGGGGAGPDPFCAPGARTTADRLPCVRPLPGAYPMRPGVAGWVAPTASNILGRGPVQFLGVFDTMPWLEDYDEAMKRNLNPVDMPGGVTLRWTLPRATNYAAAGDVNTVAPQFRRAGVGLSLYVAGVDVMPEDWQSNANYPGLTPLAAGFTYDATRVEGQWATGLSFIRPRDPSGPVTGPGGPGGARDGVRWLAEHVARPALDLLAYCGGPGAEADLGELAGGHRYVAAWLRLWWSRYDGVDPLAAVNLELPYTIQAGRALNAGHRQAWHVSIPVDGDDMASESEVFDNGKIYGVSSPIAGLWRASVCSNGDGVGEGLGLFTGLELRNANRIATDSQATLFSEHDGAAQLGSTVRHGGAGYIASGWDANGSAPIAGLVSLSVTP